jgi:hypothetical protein
VAQVCALLQAADLIRAAEPGGEQVAELAPNDPLYRAFQ